LTIRFTARHHAHRAGRSETRCVMRESDRWLSLLHGSESHFAGNLAP
jgi:hypothetical protein